MGKKDQIVAQCHTLLGKLLITISCSAEATNLGVLSREQLQLTNTSYRRDEGKIKLVHSESLSDIRKVTDCNSPRDSIRCFFRGFGGLLSGSQNQGGLNLPGNVRAYRCFGVEGRKITRNFFSAKYFHLQMANKAALSYI